MKNQLSLTYKFSSKSLKSCLSFVAVAFLVAVSLSSCTIEKGELGSEKNPIKLYFIPAIDAKVLETETTVFKKHLENTTGLHFEISIPQSYIAVVEAFGSKRADVAYLNTFGYILARDKYLAEARLTALRHGVSTYQGQFLVKVDSQIKELKDIAGKKIAYVEPASTSGYLLPQKMLNDLKVKPKETVFAMKHDAVVSMVYQGQVDVGASFYSPPENGEVQDARRLVKTQYPDVDRKLRILALTEAVPNDPVVFRKEVSDELKKKIVDAFLAFVTTPEGVKVFRQIYGIDSFKLASDKDYDGVRDALRSLGKDAAELMKK